jgi:hypothetical protein
MSDPGSLRGAYGLRVEGVDAARDLLVPAEPSWPRIALSSRRGEGAVEPEWVSPEAARLQLKTGGHIELDRARGEAVFVTGRPLGAEELVHPYLAPVASVMAHWYGRESVHAGAFLVDGRVVGVVGMRESGKSSTLAQLALEGVDIVCDDLLVLEGTRVLPGPRSLDLREEPARRLGVGRAIGKAGARERWRVRLGEVPDRLELAGWVHLVWGESVEAVPLEGAERVARLLLERGARLPSSEPSILLDLASLPSWEVRRPRVWDSLGETADCLRDLARR